MAGEREEDVALGATVGADGPTTDKSPPAFDATVASGDAPVTGGSRELPEVSEDRYAIGAEIGRGGLGRVMRARDGVLERPVALKQLFATDDGSRRRFLREALITARLQHPSIVPVYDAGRRSDRSPFYAMKLVAGQPLEREIATAKTLDVRLALIPTVLAVADAIAYAHNERIIHRDLKPANVLVGKFGETVVIDWGLAKDLAIDDRDALPIGPYRSDASTEHTVAGAVMGTPGYMAPEQAAGEDADERADVYALGAILYHVISGVLPHQGITLEAVIANVIKGDIKPVQTVEPNVPPDLAAIVGKAMATDKARRYADAGALAEDLRKFQTGQLVGAHRYTTGDRVRRWIRRHRAITLVTAVATIVLAIGATVSLRRIIAERETARTERDRAVATSNLAILNQARALRSEPARLLTVLGTMDESGPGWDAARVLAVDALGQPRLVAQTRGPEGSFATTFSSAQFALARDGKGAVAFDAAGVWVLDLGAMTTKVIRYGNDPNEIRRLELCDDGLHAYVLSGGFDRKRFHELDVRTRTVQPREGDGHVFAAAVAKCKAAFRLVADDAGLVLHDPATGKDVRFSTVPMEAAWFAPDGKHVLALELAGGVRRFDLAGNQLGALPGPEQWSKVRQLDSLHHQPLAKAEMSFDGSTVVVWARFMYTFWSFEHGRSVQPKLAKSITGSAVAPDGSVAYLSTPDGGYAIKNARDPFDEVWPEVPRGQLEISPDGAWLAGVAEGKVTILDRATNVQYALRGHVGAETVAFTPEGKLVTVGSDALRVWELPKPGRTHGRVGVHAAAFSPDGRWLVIDNGYSVARWDVAGDKLETTTERDRSTSGESSVAITNSGDIVFTAKDRVFLWPRGAPARELGKHAEAAAVSSGFLPAGPPITVSHDRVVLWPATGPRQIRLPTDGAARRPGISPFDIDARGARALVQCRPKGEARRTCLVELFSGQVELLADTTSTAAITPDGRTAITGLDNEAYAIWDLDRRQPFDKPHTSVGAVTELGISRDGTLALVGGLAGVDAIDLATREVTAIAGSERADGERLQFSPDGKTVVGDDLVIRDVATGELRPVQIKHHEAWYLSNTALTVVTRFGIVVVRDDLPRDPKSLKAMLTALPYKLDKHGALIFKSVSATATGSR